MHSIFIKNHLCSRRRSPYLDHELFYSNVVGSVVKAVMVDRDINDAVSAKKIKFISLTELRSELICHYSLMKRVFQCMLGTANDQSCICNKF